MNRMTTATPKQTNTSDAILDAANRLMARYGFQKMTMDDVAKEAGVSKRTIYVYFSGKEDLGLSSISRVVEQAHAEMRAIAAGRASVSERLREMLRRRVLARVEQVQDYAHSLDDLFAVVRPAYMELRVRFFDVERDLVAGMLRAGMGTGEFSRFDPQKTAETFLLATNAFLPYSLSVRELGSPETIARGLDHMIALLLLGATNHTRGARA